MTQQAQEAQRLKTRMWGTVVSIFSVFIMATSCYANPVVGPTAPVGATVTNAGTTTTVNQTAGQAVINWQSFNIQQNETTHFQQPTGGIALNRIDPGQGASEIYGHLSATGQVILLNQAGIYFGPNSYVNVGGLMASTGDMSDSDFLARKYHFTNISASGGSIINDGHIATLEHGFVVMTGASVVNNGHIDAQMGHVALASGDAATVSFNGNDLINFEVSAPATQAGHDKDGKVLANGVSNTGLIEAEGGTIQITAHDAQGVLEHAVNLQGVVEASSATKASDGGVNLNGNAGTVELDGGNGDIIVSGTVAANSVHGQGGTVTAEAKTIDVTSTGQVLADGSSAGGNVIMLGDDSATVNGKVAASSRNGQGGQVAVMASNVNVSGQVNVNGAEGGGTVNLGGSAKTTTVASTARIMANAMVKGNGGDIVVSSTDNTTVNGSLSAQGGAQGGNGGQIETEGGLLNVDGIKLSLTAAQGKVGTWSLASNNLIIQNGSQVQSDEPEASTVDVNSLVNNLLGANVDATASSGDLTVASTLSWDAATALTLTAYNDIILSGNSSSPLINGQNKGSSVSLNANNIQFASGSAGSTTITAGNVTLNGNAVLNQAAKVMASNGDVNINGGVSGGYALTIGETGQNSEITGDITGANTALIETGSGKLTVSGSNNNYSGGTQVESGTLSVASGSSLGTGQVNVDTGATLALANVALTNSLNLQGSGAPGLSGALVVAPAALASINGAVAISGDTKVAVGTGGQVEFVAPVDAAVPAGDPAPNLFLSGSAQFDSAVGASSPLNSLVANGDNIILHSVTTGAGGQSYTGQTLSLDGTYYSAGGAFISSAEKISLSGDTVIDTTHDGATQGGNINLGDMDGANHSLILNAGTAGLITASAFSSAGGNLTIDNSGSTQFNGPVTASTVSVQNTASSVAFNNALRAENFDTSAQGYDILIDGGGSSVVNPVVFSNLGTVVLGSEGGSNITFEGGVTSLADTTIVAGTVKSNQITLLGNHVFLLASSVLDVSGVNGGGTVFIGGGAQGQGPLAHAQTVTMDAGAQILADAIGNGNGGHVVLWSDEDTEFHGYISAQGGALGGNGGLIETSGHYIDVQGSAVSALAPKGQVGTWLLDPTGLTICTSCSTSTNTSFNFGSTVSTLFVGGLTSALASASVTVETAGGDLVVATPITWSSLYNLTLISNGGAIVIQQPITAVAGSLTVGDNSATGITLYASANITTFGAQSYNAPVTLFNPGTGIGSLTLAAAAGSITLGLVDDAAGSHDSLVLSGANANILGTVGGSTPINSLTLIGGGNDVLNGNITTNTSQTYSNNFSVNASTVTLEAMTGNITIGGSVALAPSGNGNTLTVQADAGNIYLNPSYGNNGSSTMNAIYGSATVNQVTNVTTYAPNTTSALILSASGLITSTLVDGITANANGVQDSIYVATFNLEKGSWLQNNASLPASVNNLSSTAYQFYAGNFILAATGASFLRVLGGNGASTGAEPATGPYELTDIYGLQGITSLSLSNNYVLMNNIDATVTSSWNTGDGFRPIGPLAVVTGGTNPSVTFYSGVFNGNTFTINNLYIDYDHSGSAAPTDVGLFTGISGTVEGLGLNNATVKTEETTGVNLGAIAGSVNNGGLLTGDYILNGVVAGPAANSPTIIGGLVGLVNNGGSIGAAVNTGTYSGAGAYTGAVTISNGTIEGGLVGENNGSIYNSYSLATVTGGTGVTGGLVGENAITASEIKVLPCFS